MDPEQIIDLAAKSESVKEDLVETFLLDAMSQLNALDPSDDGDELINIMKTALENSDENENTLQLLSYLLGAEFQEWLEEFMDD